ncbi:MAG: hypothetical protein F6K55_29430 [Moorea sp. SIO4A3]|nr:hypothetical protein [Moorena sp. SIO4A3]
MVDAMREYLSDAARSWGGSAVLGVSPMSDCRGFPHERLHQERKNTELVWSLPNRQITIK